MQARRFLSTVQTFYLKSFNGDNSSCTGNILYMSMYNIIYHLLHPNYQDLCTPWNALCMLNHTIIMRRHYWHCWLCRMQNYVIKLLSQEFIFNSGSASVILECMSVYANTVTLFGRCPMTVSTVLFHSHSISSWRILVSLEQTNVSLTAASHTFDKRGIHKHTFWPHRGSQTHETF